MTSPVDDGLIIQGSEAKGTKITCLNVDAGLEHPEQWVGTYAIHVYNTTDVTLESVTATGGNGGILVNGSEVVLQSDELGDSVQLGGNGFGGIEVSKGENLTASSTLTIADNTDQDGKNVPTVLFNDSEVYGQPTIWVVKDQGSIANNSSVKLTSSDKIVKDQIQYYLDANNVVAPTVPVTKVTISSESLTLPQIGSKAKLSATVEPNDATNADVTWASSDESVATVDANGLVTAVKSGSATITATADGKQSAPCTVTVQNITKNDAINEVSDKISKLPSNPTQGQVQDAVQTVLGLNDETRKALSSDNIEKLDKLLESVSKNVTTTVAAPTAEPEVNANDKITEKPTVSGLLLAAGITGNETTSISLNTTQIVPTGSGSVLALKLDLTVGGNAVHTLLVPVTVTIKLPSTFVYDSSKHYQVHHVKDDGSSEDLPLTILYVGGVYTGTFTTSSFSTFTVVGTSNGSGSNPGSNPGSGTTPVTVTPTQTFVSDTNHDFNVNGAYQFKITSTNGVAPVFVVGTPGVFDYALVKTDGNDYYFKITTIGNAGAKAGIYVNGTKLLVATVGADFVIDTTHPFNVKAKASYVFKVTANAKPTFVSGTSSAFVVEFVKAVGKDYFFKVTAIGKVGVGCGFYVNSQRTPVAVATITK